MKWPRKGRGSRNKKEGGFPWWGSPLKTNPREGERSDCHDSTEWKRIKLDGCEEEFTIKVGFPVDEKGNYAGKDKYGFTRSFGSPTDRTSPSTRKREFLRNKTPVPFAVNSLPSRFNEKLAAARFIEAGGFPWAVCLAGKELKQVNPSFGDHL